MTKTKAIVVEIDETGAVKIEGHGFVGPDCAKASAFLETALGVKTGEAKKPEYSQTVVNVQKVQQR